MGSAKGRCGVDAGFVHPPKTEKKYVCSNALNELARCSDNAIVVLVASQVTLSIARIKTSHGDDGSAPN